MPTFGVPPKEFYSDGWQSGLRYCFAFASHDSAAPMTLLVMFLAAFGRGGLEDTSSSYKTLERDMAQVEKREA